MHSPLVRPLAAVLLVGTILLVAATAMHPVLAGDAGAQLRVIAGTRNWRAIHLAMLAGTGLVIAGVWVRLLVERDSAPAPLLIALALLSLGLAFNALNIAYMAGAGGHMAALYEAGDSSIAPIFEATHPIGLMAARFGNFLVALGALALGWVEWSDAARPRWVAVLAWLAAAGGLAGALFFPEGSPLVLAAVGLLSGWQVATGARGLAIAR